MPPLFLVLPLNLNYLTVETLKYRLHKPEAPRTKPNIFI